MNHLDYVRDLADGNAYYCKQIGNERAKNVFLRLWHEVACLIDSPPFIGFNRAVNRPWQLDAITRRLEKYHGRIIDHEINPSAAEYLDALTKIHGPAA